MNQTNSNLKFFENYPIDENLTIIKKIRSEVKEQLKTEPPISSEVINKVRSAILERIERKPKYARDGAMIVKDDFWITRFLQDSGSKQEDVLVKKGISKLKDCLRWRHRFGINDLKASDLPAFLFKLHHFVRDSDGNVFWFVKGYDLSHSSEDLYDLQCNMVTFLMEQLELAVNKNGDRISVVSLIDKSNMGFFTAGAPSWRIRKRFARLFYPNFEDHPLVTFEIPFRPHPVAKLGVSQSKKKLFKRRLSSVDNINVFETFSGANNVPTECGGQLKTYTYVPRDAMSFEEFVIKYEQADFDFSAIERKYSYVINGQ